MTEKKINEMGFPEVFYARHMQEGVVNYPETNEVNLITNETLTGMAKSFEGKPVFVNHQDVDLDNLKEQADGYVASCFYNKYDGWWWLKFIAVSDLAKKVIAEGWKVSNCYDHFMRGAGGTWHGVEYDSELLGDDIGYEHLAIVPNPRYEGAMILTEEAYNKYIEDLKAKLDKKMNSKVEEKPMFKLFQKKVNETPIDDVYIDLGNDEQVLLKDALDKFEELRNADAEAEAKANRKIANSDDEVSLHDGSKVKVSDIIARINKCNEEAKAEEEAKANACKNSEDEKDKEEDEKENSEDEKSKEEDEKENSEEEDEKENSEEDSEKENSEEDDKENSEEDKEEDKDKEKENEADEEEDDKEKENKKKNSSELRNAYLNSGLSDKIEDKAEFKKGKELIDGFEKARRMGI